MLHVSSHAPVRGHPRFAVLEYQQKLVSSHAPVRGHLKKRVRKTGGISVSSHAPVRGHLISNAIMPPQIGFKSCPREGASVD